MKTNEIAPVKKKLDPSHREVLRYLAEGMAYYEAAERIGLTGVKRTQQWKIRSIVEGALKLANKGQLSEVDIELLSLANKRISSRVNQIDNGKELSEVFENKTRMALKGITPAKIKASSAAQLMLIAAQAADKMRLLHDKSTQNIAIKGEVNLSNLSNEELVERMKKSREEYTQKNAE